MRQALIVNGEVVNVIVANQGYVIDGFEMVPTDEAEIGWRYGNGLFSPPEIEAGSMFPALQAWQFQAVVDIAGLREPIETVIAAMDEPERTITARRFEHTSTFYRDDPLFDELDEAIGVTSDEIDALWLYAASISARS